MTAHDHLHAEEAHLNLSVEEKIFRRASAPVARRIAEGNNSTDVAMDSGNTRQLKSVANVNLRVLSKSLGSVVVVAFSINPNVEVPLAQLKEKRRKFSVRERQDNLGCS